MVERQQIHCRVPGISSPIVSPELSQHRRLPCPTWYRGKQNPVERGLVSSRESMAVEDNEFRVGDVPPGAVLVVGDAAVFNVDAVFYATQALCTHRQGPLSRGRIEGSTVTCPNHGAQFDVKTGAVVRGPAREPLATYRVTVEGNVGRVEGDS